MFDAVRDRILIEQFGALEVYELDEFGNQIKLVSNIAVEAVAALLALEHLEGLGLAATKPEWVTLERLPGDDFRDDLEFSRHARHRLDEMGLCEEEVLEVVRFPEIVLPNDPGHPEGSKYIADALCVAVAPDGVIMTVLWNGADGRDAQGQARFEGGSHE